MARKKLEYSEIYPYHIYGKSNNAEWFYIPIQDCWKIFCYFLKYVAAVYNFRIHAFVLMNNHYHLIASTPDNNLSLIMNRLMTEISKAINEIAGRSNHVFGGQYRATIIKNGPHYVQGLKYVYQNPIVVNLSKNVEDYVYSTAGGLIGKHPLLLTLEKCDLFDDFIPEDYFVFLEKMNEIYSPEQRSLIKKAMKRREYKLNKRSDKNLF